MPLLKAILTLIGAAIAVMVGLLTAAVVAFVAAVYFVAQRLLGRNRPPQVPSEVRRPRPAGSGDVIDVTATEVRTEPPTR